MGRSKTRPAYAQKLNYTGVIWHKGGTHRSPLWQCKLTAKATLGEGKGQLHLGYFRDDEDEYVKAAKAWDRARIALAYVRKELIHLLSADARKESGCKLNFARETYQDIVEMLKGVEIPTNTDAVRALVKAVALEEPLPQPGSPGTSHEAADGDEEVKLQDLITNEKDASDEAEESPLPSVRRAAGQASRRRKRSDTPPEDTPAAKVQKRAPPRTVPASVAVEVQQQAAMLEELRQAQAAEELRRDRREAELKLKIESLAEKCAQQERVITHLLADGDQKRALIAQQQQLLARFAAGTP